MKLRIACLMGVLAGFVFSPPAQAADDDIDVGCDAVATFLGPASGAIFGVPLAGSGWGAVFAAGMASLGSKYASPPIASGCKNYLENWSKRTDFNYESFVSTICGGNPFACPNGWNAMGPLPDRPQDCSKLVVCNFAFAVRTDGSLSVQDIINAGTFVELSRYAGYWDFERYGYLVGVTQPSKPTTGQFEVY